MDQAASDYSRGFRAHRGHGWLTGLVVVACLLVWTPDDANAAARWQPVGPSGGIISHVTAAPSVNHVLYAVVNTGRDCLIAQGCHLVYRSGDGGESWQRRGALEFEPRALRVDPANPNKLFAGGFEALYVSVDGGGTWQRHDLEGERVTDIAINPLNPQTVFASTLVQNWPEGGIYRSVDGGESWQRLVTTPVEYWFRGLSVDPVNAGWLYVWAGDELYRSTDAGNTWSAPLATVDFVDFLLVDPSTPSTLYAATRLDGVYKSIDSGATWLPANEGLGGGETEIWMEPQAPHVLYARDADGFYRSLDGGGQWIEMSDGPIGTGVADLAPVAGSPGTVFAGVEAGLFKSIDGGATWSPSSRGLLHSQVKSFARHPTDPWTIYAITAYGGAGHAFAGLQVSFDGGASWQGTSLNALPTFGDASLRFSPTDPTRLWASVAFHGVWQSENGATSWALYTQGLSGFGESLQFTRLAVDPADPDRLFLGSSWSGDGNAYRSTGGGFEWLNSDFNHGVYDFAIDSARSTVYAATDLGAWRSHDGGVTFERILNVGLGSAYSIAFHPDQADTVYWGGSDRFYYTLDGGATWDLSLMGTGGREVRSLLLDPSSPSTLYAAVDEGGVFMSADGGLSWQPLMDGLDAGGIVEMRFDPRSSRILWLATEHYGLYRLALDELFVDGFEAGDTARWDLTVSN